MAANSLWDTWRIYHGAFVDDELMELKPVKGEDANPSLQDLQNINADVCAWLTIDDTGIDYPVVRGKDDMEYINKDVYGNFALSGSIFLSSANQPDFTDPYNLIYGHHMSNGAMFGDVVEFTDEAYFTAHETGTLYLPEETSRLQSLPAWRRKPQTDESMAISQNRTQPGRCRNFYPM